MNFDISDSESEDILRRTKDGKLLEVLYDKSHHDDMEVHNSYAGKWLYTREEVVAADPLRVSCVKPRPDIDEYVNMLDEYVKLYMKVFSTCLHWPVDEWEYRVKEMKYYRRIYFAKKAFFKNTPFEFSE